VLDLQDIFGSVFDDVGNGMPMCGAHQQRLQNQEVKRSLKQLAFQAEVNLFWA
jgi:hypothetical protein